MRSQSSPRSGRWLAVWKVYHIQTGRIVKAGFDSDEQAKDWLERRKDLPDDEHDTDEMDDEEEEDYLENEADEEEEDEEAFEADDEDREIPFAASDLGVDAEDVDVDDDDAGDEEDEVDDDEDDDDDHGGDDDDDDDE